MELKNNSLLTLLTQNLQITLPKVKIWLSAMNKG